MSWSVNAIGRASAVAKKLKSDFERIKCSEPEETIKNTVAVAVTAALDAFPPDTAVKVEASGSQYCPDSTKPDQKFNNLTVKLEPLYGFVESFIE